VEKFEIEFHRNAAKSYQRLPKAVKRRIDEAIETLRANPFWGKDILKLRGNLAGRYRLRVGEYRIVYRIIEEQRLVIVEAIGTRGEVY